jgi:hypothetical protein
MEANMKRQKQKPGSVQSHDYRRALQSAVSWLGDRYLLAQPVQRRDESGKPFFVESRSWYPATRH